MERPIKLGFNPKRCNRKLERDENGNWGFKKGQIFMVVGICKHWELSVGNILIYDEVIDHDLHMFSLFENKYKRGGLLNERPFDEILKGCD